MLAEIEWRLAQEAPVKPTFPVGALNFEEAEYIRQAAREGMTLQAMAEWWGVSRKVIKDVLSGRTWQKQDTVEKTLAAQRVYLEANLDRITEKQARSFALRMQQYERKEVAVELERLEQYERGTA